jgi:hypothetical protein
LLRNAQSVLDTSARVNVSLFISSVLIAAEAASASSGSGLKNEILQLLGTVTQSQTSVNGAATNTIAGILQRLSADLTASQSNTLLAVAAALTNRSTVISQEAGNTMLSVVESTAPGMYGPRDLSHESLARSYTSPSLWCDTGVLVAGASDAALASQSIEVILRSLSSVAAALAKPGGTSQRYYSAGICK